MPQFFDESFENENESENSTEQRIVLAAKEAFLSILQNDELESEKQKQIETQIERLIEANQTVNPLGVRREIVLMLLKFETDNIVSGSDGEEPLGKARALIRRFSDTFSSLERENKGQDNRHARTP